LKEEKEIATVRYTWYNNTLSKLYCHIDYGSGYAGLWDEYEKKYKYDSHNNISVIEFREIHGSQWNRKIYEFNNEYNSIGQLATQNVVYRKTTAWDIERGKPEEIRTHTRSYTYDEKGNWIKMIENRDGAQSVMQRKITYSDKKVGEVDIENIYDDEEVEIHATFGATIKSALNRNEIDFNRLWPYTDNLVINVRFVIGRDGRAYFYDEPMTNKEGIDEAVSRLVIPYIKSLPWVPASINNTFVKSLVTLSWKYNYSNDRYSREILKDVVFTSAEDNHFESNYSKFKSIKANMAKAEKLEKLKKQANEKGLVPVTKYRMTESDGIGLDHGALIADAYEFVMRNKDNE
jgi:hypothetical protein